MFRCLNAAKFEYNKGGWFSQPGWWLTSRIGSQSWEVKVFVRLDESAYRQAMDTHESHAVLLGEHSDFVGGKRWINKTNIWMFRGLSYETNEMLDPEEALRRIALIIKREEKRALQADLIIQRLGLETENGGSSDKRRAPIPRDVQIFVWQRDERKCVKCGSNQNLEFDHIIPLAMGGSNTARNLQLLCADCNRSKGANLA
jgi:hypothetical protein